MTNVREESIDYLSETEKIKQESEKQLQNGSAEEMSDVIFDTLFNNTRFPQLDMDCLTDISETEGDTQEVNRHEKWIRFGYKGHIYKVTVELEK